MIGVDQHHGSTSAGGAMGVRRTRGPLLVRVVAADVGTSSAGALPEAESATPHLLEQTSGGAAFVPADRAGAAMAELRRMTGLKWEQLARLFGVSRRALHFWASGKEMAAGNEEHLHRLCAVMRRVDRGSASANRTALLGVLDDGRIPFDLLTAREYDRVVALLGESEGGRVRPPRVSAAELRRRAPPAPEDLAGALTDRVHPVSGRLLDATPVRVARRK
jgi:DNA-binding transcriptional regulator YiaG